MTKQVKRARKQGQTKIIIQIPFQIKEYLDDLAMEGYTASGYLRKLIMADRQARIETGWKPGKQGWVILD